MSCYCSASHTDNNYSTDEHDSVRDSAHRPNAYSLTQKLGLHQSDSGADLSEYHDQHEAKSIQNLLASYGKTFQSTETELEDGFEKVNVLLQNQQENDLEDESKIVDIHSSDHHLAENIKDLSINPSSCSEKKYRVEGSLFILGEKDTEIQNISKNISSSDRETYNKDVTYSYEHNSHVYPYSMYSGTKSTMDFAWEKYWSENGEQLIWTSWITKYADYINPEYLQHNVQLIEDERLEMKETIEKFSEQNTCFPNQAHRNCELDRSNFEGIFSKSSNTNDNEIKAKDAYSVNFSFDDISKQDINDKDAEENRRKLTGLETSPETGDGWNPLSPYSIEESYNQQSNAEDERLLTRCDSVNESIAKTNATSDSMTNVTKMTLTSSSCDSISMHSFSLISSVTSSIESNITSTSSDQDNEYGVEDNDRYWQHLWKENFQIEYQKHYELFIESYKKERSALTVPSYQDQHNNKDVKEEESNKSMDQGFTQIDLSNKIDISEDINSFNTNLPHPKKEKTKKKRLIMESVGALIQNLKVTLNGDESTQEENRKTNGNECSSKNKDDGQSSVAQSENTAIMSGNAIRSNCLQRKCFDEEDGEGDEPHKSKPVKLKRRYVVDCSLTNDVEGIIIKKITCSLFSHEVDYDETTDGLERVKKAFSLMGYAFNKGQRESKLQGDVIYRKKNIRLQNRQLKMKFCRSKPTSKHIYFDDNGMEITNTIDKVNLCFKIDYVSIKQILVNFFFIC